MKKGEDNSDTIIKAIITNANPDDLEEFDMQAAVPKYMKVQMKPISDPIIPGNNEDISTQLIRVKNNAFGEVRMIVQSLWVEGHGDEAENYLCVEWPRDCEDCHGRGDSR